MVNPMELVTVFFLCFFASSELSKQTHLWRRDVRFQTLQMLDLRRLHEHGSNGHRRGKLNRADLSGPIGQVGGLFCVQELRHRRGRKWCWSKQKVRDPGVLMSWFFWSGHWAFWSKSAFEAEGIFSERKKSEVWSAHSDDIALIAVLFVWSYWLDCVLQIDLLFTCTPFWNTLFEVLKSMQIPYGRGIKSQILGLLMTEALATPGSKRSNKIRVSFFSAKNC